MKATTAITLSHTESVNVANSAFYYFSSYNGQTLSKLEECELINADTIRRSIIYHLNRQTMRHQEKPIKLTLDEAGCTAIAKAVYNYWKTYPNLYFPDLSKFAKKNREPACLLCHKLRSATLNVLDKTTRAYLSICPKHAKGEAFRSLFYSPVKDKCHAHPVALNHSQK